MSDPTPTTPVTVQDRIRMALTALAGSPAADLETIRAQMYAALMYTADPIHYPWLSLINSKIESIEDRLDKIQAVLGAEPYSSTETANIRALLMQLVNNASIFGIAPDGLTNSTSLGSVSIEGRRYITWGDISGVTESGDGRSLTPNVSWSGYEIYIQTDAPSAYLIDEIESAQSIDNFAANSWIALGGTHRLSFAVDASYQVRGYMRVPTVYDWISVFSGGKYRVVPVTISPYFVNNGAGEFSNDCFGYIFRIVSGGTATVTIASAIANISNAGYDITDQNDHIFPHHSNRLWVASDAAYTLRITPQ